MDRAIEPNSISPIVKGILGGVAVFVAAQVLIFLLIPPALAAVAIPITDRITINMGELLNWAQFLLAAAGFWMIYRKASNAEAASLKAVEQTDGVLEKIAAMSKKEGKQEERTEVAAAKEAVRKDAVADAEVASRVQAIASHNDEPGGEGLPLPVADDRTASASERVAAATERSADAQQRVADVSEKDKGLP